MRLTSKERSYLNQIYVSAYKKYFTMSTDYGIEMDASRIESVEPLTWEESLALATAQLGARRAQINAAYNEKIALAEANHIKTVALLNTEAQKRGLINSTIVVQSLSRAFAEKTAKIELLESERVAKLDKLEGETLQSLARKIHSDATRNAVSARRLNLTIAQSKSMQQARSLTARIRNTIQTSESQRLLDEEVYAAYLSFLFGYSVSDALSLINDEPVFGLNLSETYYTKLQQEMARRGY